jgi:phosphoglucomutase
MSQNFSPLAGTQATALQRVDVGRLLAAYFDLQPDASIASQQIVFGTSGHRGCSLACSFNQWHVWAMVQAICDYRKSVSIEGPLFLGFDTHALSAPAFESALEVLAGNAVEVRIARDGEYTPTPAISHAILAHNAPLYHAVRDVQDRVGSRFALAKQPTSTFLSDGIVITPSHNPPDWGGLKYNPPNGGPADTIATSWIQARANELLAGHIVHVRKVPFSQAKSASTTHTFDFLGTYVADLGSVVDMEAIHSAALTIGVDPMGGAGVHYWARIADHYKIDLTVIDSQVDPQFGFMSLDWDAKIRMDPSSAFAMKRLIAMKDQFAICFACDTDHDRHGIVTPSSGLLSANHFLSAAIDYLFSNRRLWDKQAGIGKTVVCSAQWDRVARALGRSVYEVPVGFKYFADPLLNGALVFAGEESAGASFARIDGRVWTTDKDGIAAALLAAEMTAVSGRDPGENYQALANVLGATYTDRVEAPATAAQKKLLGKLAPQSIRSTTLAGDAITQVLDRAPGNQAPLGGIKVSTNGGWFVARPSGTEDVYKIYAESYSSEAHLNAILIEAQAIVDATLAVQHG